MRTQYFGNGTRNIWKIQNGLSFHNENGNDYWNRSAFTSHDLKNGMRHFQIARDDARKICPLIFRKA